MPALLYQVITLVFDLSVVVFVVFYILGVRNKEKKVDQKEGKIDSEYQTVVGQGLAQERQIIENAVNQSHQMMQVATHQANQILAGTQFISQTTKATLDTAVGQMVGDVSNVSSSSKISLEQALQKIVGNV